MNRRELFAGVSAVAVAGLAPELPGEEFAGIIATHPGRTNTSIWVVSWGDHQPWFGLGADSMRSPGANT